MAAGSCRPGFLMKGYTSGTKDKPTTQLIFVECAGVSKAAGQKLEIDYSYITGPFNYYVPSQKSNGTMKLDLDKVVTDAKYPVAVKIDSLEIAKPGVEIDAINKCTVQLTAVKRTDTGFEFDWQSTNPSQYPAYVHIGIPPVIGADGVMYGFYESPHLSDAPITPAGDKGNLDDDDSRPQGRDWLLYPSPGGDAAAEVLRGSRGGHNRQVASATWATQGGSRRRRRASPYSPSDGRT